MRKAVVIGSVSVSLVMNTCRVLGQTPAAQPQRAANRTSSAPSAGQEAALDAAAPWLKLIDSGNFKAAAAGLVEETKALFHWPTPEENIAAIAALFSQSRGDAGMNHPNDDADFPNYPNYKFSRILVPDSVKKVQSCPCGIPPGTFYVMSYDFKSTWNALDRRSHSYVPSSRQGTDTLYMMLEKDGNWKPAALFWIPKK